MQNTNQVDPKAVFDMLDYLRGDGSVYEMENDRSKIITRYQYQADGNKFFLVLNSQWQEFWYDTNSIYVGTDTSQNATEVQISKHDGNLYGSVLIPRFIQINKTFLSNPIVNYQVKTTGNSSKNPTVVKTWYVFANAISNMETEAGVLSDVIELWLYHDENNARGTVPYEKRYYAKNIGLIRVENDTTGTNSIVQRFTGNTLAANLAREKIFWLVTPNVAITNLFPALNDPRWKDAVAHSTTTTNVRQNPNATSSVVGRIEKNTTIKLLVEAQSSQTDGNWIPMLIGAGFSIQGWARSDVFSYDLVDQISGGVSIEVPYFSQEGIGAEKYRDDCGPAAVRMLIDFNDLNQGRQLNTALTVNSISAAIGLGVSQYSTPYQLQQVALKYGLKLNINTQATIDRIIDELNAKRPVISLIYYGVISKRLNVKFTGGHYVVVVGYDDDEMILNDPDWYGASTQKGKNFHVPRAEFINAISNTVVTGNMPNQSLFIDSNQPPVQVDWHTTITVDHTSDYLTHAKLLQQLNTALSVLGSDVKVKIN